MKTRQTVISRIENPDIDYMPSLSVLMKIAGALDTNLELAFVPKKAPRPAISR